jgi:hypothetical protein
MGRQHRGPANQKLGGTSFLPFHSSRMTEGCQRDGDDELCTAFQDRSSTDATIVHGNRLCENCQKAGALLGTRECQCLSQIGADLQRLMQVWPKIPSQFRKQILEIVKGPTNRVSRKIARCKLEVEPCAASGGGHGR